MNEQIMTLISQLTGGGSKGMVRDVGESKSIDDIIKQSDMFELLSKAMADKTNVDSSEMPMRDDITKYSSDDPLDLLFKMRNNERRPPVERDKNKEYSSFIQRLMDLVKAKPKEL